MRFIAMYRPAVSESEMKPPTPEMMQGMGALMQEMMEKGLMIGAEGLFPSAMGSRVRLADGQITVNPGPFPEQGNIAMGYAVYQMDSMEDAVTWTERFLHLAGDGECEIRPLMEMGDCCQPMEECAVAAP